MNKINLTLRICQLVSIFHIILQIPFRMNKSLARQNRQFGVEIKNTFQENDVEAKLALKPRSRKRIQTSQFEAPVLAEMQYFDEVMKYVLTAISYPHILKGTKKVKRDVQTLLHEITSVKGQNFIWNENFMNMGDAEDSYFFNEEITLQKRTSLIGWILTIHKKYGLRQQTLHLTIKLIDDHAQKNNIPLKKYQLLAAVALFMAAKYQETELPRIGDYFKFAPSQCTKEEFIQMEKEVLCKAQFNLTRKVSILWYLEAFGLKQVIFGKNANFISNQKRSTEEDKQNINEHWRENLKEAIKDTLKQKSKTVIVSGQNPFEERFKRFMSQCKYILNLILLDYKITTKYKEDIVAISILTFVSMQISFAETDSKQIFQYLLSKRSKLIQQNEPLDEVSRSVKKCMQKIGHLYKKRHEQRFKSVSEKFDIVPKK